MHNEVYNDHYDSILFSFLQHLSCFLPGLFALGAHSLSLRPEEKQLHLWIADGLTQTCYISYADQISGLGPEEMQFSRKSTLWYPQYKIWKKSGAARQNGALPPGVKLPKDLKPEKEGPKRDYRNRRDAYLLRPEVGFLALPFRVSRLNSRRPPVIGNRKCLPHVASDRRRSLARERV